MRSFWIWLGGAIAVSVGSWLFWSWRRGNVEASARVSIAKPRARRRKASAPRVHVNGHGRALAART